MNLPRRHWNLGAKLALVGAPFLLLALLSTAATLWVAWQLDGGAAAVNEAGRLRMQVYRMSLAVASGDAAGLPQRIVEFDRSLAVLRAGDPERPLFVPWDDTVRQQFDAVAVNWPVFRARWLDARPSTVTGLRADTVAFTGHIDTLVAGIETHLTRWTAILHLLQIGVLTVAILGSTVILFSGYLFVLEPVGQLKEAIQKIQGGDLDARVERVGTDEFGMLAAGFNGMAEHLQSMYQKLESKVRDKTAELEEKRERLEALYEVSGLVARATSLDDLAQEFSRVVMRIARADAVALRWSDQANQRFLMLAASGLPSDMVKNEQCLQAGDCACGTPSTGGMKLIQIRQMPADAMQHCTKAGFSTLVNIPIMLHERQMGEATLFYHAELDPSAAERSLFEALTSHLASAMENLRLNALEKEAAISGERNLLSRELHDSIAQSLAFLKIQVQLMRDAMHAGDAAGMQAVLDEIDLGVRESYGDVRELLTHFRTRTNTEDIEPALATTLRKFEHQTGLKATLKMTGHALPMSPDLQIQVLHIVQEALTNVRKHARASQVWLDVQQQPAWRFEVRDDGIGFTPRAASEDDSHVGLGIMSERAQRIGARLEVVSAPREGSSVILTLPTATVAPKAQTPFAAAGKTARAAA